MQPVFICDYARTAIGRYGGALAPVRPDDLAAKVLASLSDRNPEIDRHEIDEVCLGCANQAGEDNRNVARMAVLIAGYPTTVPAVTLNRLCGSGMDAIAYAARKIRCGEADIAVGGGVESMSRAPFVMPKSETAFTRSNSVYDTTIGWRFVNPRIKTAYGVDSMPETAENLAEEFGISRTDQDEFALKSQKKAARAQSDGTLDEEIIAVEVPQRKGGPITVDKDEHLKQTSLEALAKLPTLFRRGGTVTAGNSSGVNDGAAAVLLLSERALSRTGLQPLAQIQGCATAGCEPRIMGIGPVPAVKKLCKLRGFSVQDFGVIELNEAFAGQSLAVLRSLSIDDADSRVNRNGGAIALGHPLGMSGARIVGTAALEMRRTGAQAALATMCIGVGQGIAMAITAP